jgi:replicative DNA helicase
VGEEATVERVADAIGEQYGHAAPIAAPTAAPAVVEPANEEGPGIEHFSFDAEFQSKIAALALRDADFVGQVQHLLKPEYFENAAEATLVNMALGYYKTYARLPDRITINQLVKDDVAAKIIRKDLLAPIIQTLKSIREADLGDRVFAVEKVAQFARHQAVAAAIYKSVDLLDKKKFDSIETLMKAAVATAAETDGGDYDYFKAIEVRTGLRLDKAAGKVPPTGITTGIHQLNERLMHVGWGRKELAVLLGGAKSGKSMALVNFARYAALAGFNVLAVTLEMSKEIWADRLDASITGTDMKELGKKIHDVRAKIEALMANAGTLKLHEYPTGSFSPSDLRRLINKYKAKGVLFDMVVVDYADIMAPDHRTDDAIENSKNIYIGLRAIASEENVAMLTATQTNRLGHSASVAKAEHVAEDFNKVRIADLLISINATDDERARSEARLHFAASRNQESGFTIIVRQDRAKMQFIVAIIGVE